MSKKHGHRKKRRKHQKPPEAFACPRCHSPADPAAGALHRALADVLNAFRDAGIKVKMTGHGVIYTSDGLVLPPSAGSRWRAVLLPKHGDLAADTDWDSPAGDEK